MARQILVMVMVLTANFAVGCDTSSESLIPEPVISTPLPLDPSQDIGIPMWWSNGTEMLQLKEDAGYALFGDQNRYHKPIQRGRWTRQSYAVIRLHPYERWSSEWIRAGLSRIDEEVALTVLDLEPMYGIESPPVVLEDALLGTWSGPAGVLVLNENRKYEFSPAAAALEQPTIMVGHHGRWRVIGEHQVLLTADAPNLGPFELFIEVEDETLTLITPAGTLEREEPPAAQAPVS